LPVAGAGASAASTGGGALAVDDPALVGQWSGVIPWPAVAVHSIVLKNGRVLWFRGDEIPVARTYVWDPLTNDIVSQEVASDIFCSGHSFLPDGRVLVTGGAILGRSAGPPTAFLFDPESSSWTREPDMRRGRFYPTNVPLGDGRTVVVAGLDENSDPNPLVEIFVPGANGEPDRWDLLEGADLPMDFYPRLHLLPSGDIVRVGPEARTMRLDMAAGRWSPVATSHYPDRDDGSSVMLPPGHTKIMIVGGVDVFAPGGLAMDTAEIIDMADPAPAWTDGARMHYHRVQANAVILPDGKVLVAGGCEDIRQTRPVLPAEIYDPAVDTWTEVASMTVPRLYHSSAVLLPDGRVLWAGANGNPTAEIYSPAYLFQGSRPTIRTSPDVLRYGAGFRIRSPQARAIASVVLLRPGAATHAQNMEQRYVALPFAHRGARQLLVTAPTEPSIAPPGPYLMFLVDDRGVPSVARMVHVGP
jgi:hypothetical protein